MEKKLVVLDCGCTYKTFDNCVCDNTYCAEHKAVQDKSSSDFERAELLCQKKSEISALEIKNLRKLYDGEDMTAVNAERLKLRNEIKQLEAK